MSADAEPVDGVVAEPEPEPPPEPLVLRALASAELAIGCVFLVIIFISVSWQVVSRYFPSLNWQGVAELGNYSFVVLTFVMVGYLIGKNGHITIQIIDYVAKGKAFVAVKAVSAAFTALICGMLAYESWALIADYPDRATAALEIPLWLLYAVPLLGFTSGVVRAVIRIFTANRPDPVLHEAEAS